jgi:hypothetical protein
MHTYATPIMKQLAATNRQTTLDQVEQLMNETGVVVAPQNALVDVLVKQFHVSSAQTPHLMNELGWKKVNVKWGGADYVRVLWIHSDFMVDRGKIYGPDHDGTKVVDYLEGLPTTNPFAEMDLAL